MRMVRWMCGVKLKDRLPSKELRERLGVDDIALVLQQNRLRWYGHVLQKDVDDWVKKCMEYAVEGPRPRGRPKRTWREVVREDCQARKLNKEDAMDRCKWRKVIKDVWWSGWVWVRECFFWYRPTRVVSDKRPLNGCVCVFCAPCGMVSVCQVLPVNHCSEQVVNQASSDLVQKHRTQFVTERILAQVGFFCIAVQTSAYWENLFLSFCIFWCLPCTCLQCFDAVGWATGRASGL